MTQMTSDNINFRTADVIEQAAEHIAEYGLARGNFGSKHAPTCMVGALRVVTESESGTIATVLRASAIRAIEKMISGDQVTSYSDSHSKRKVIKKMTRTTKALRTGKLNVGPGQA